MGNSQIFGALAFIVVGYFLVTVVLIALTIWTAWTGHYIWTAICGVPECL